MSGCCCSEGKEEQNHEVLKGKTSFSRGWKSRREAESASSRSAQGAVCCTFQDVNTLFVGWIRVGVVWRREHAAVDVADPRATVVLVGALDAMFDRRILQQKGGEQTNKLVIDLGRSMRGCSWVWKERKRKGGHKKARCLRIYTYLWILVLLKVGSNDVLLKYFRKRQRLVKSNGGEAYL